MLKLILRQANWGILGALFAFSVGFFVKIYLIDIVGLQAWGKYATAQTFSSISETFLSIGIPFVIISERVEPSWGVEIEVMEQTHPACA